MLGIGESLVFAGLLVASFAISFLIAVPIAGTLVRFRANYTPKGLQLDGEGGVQPHTGPVVNSYFAMFKRVKRLEGWSGLYKGFMPGFLSSLVIVAFIAVLPGTPIAHTGGHKKYTAPVEGVWNRLAYSLFMMVISLPVTIISNRSITTPYKLPWFKGIYSLRVLLTSSERSRPWILFLTPGLLASEVLRIAYVVLLMDPLRLTIFPPTPPSDEAKLFGQLSIARLSLYLALAVISTAILCPLEVVSTRLSIQRNHVTPGFSAVAQDEDADINDVVYSASDEDVIGLRTEDDPYIGLVDCMKRIVREEGYKTLFRAWWLVLIPLLMVAFTS
ncbi:hypothetical protein DFH11DRAFT_412876 [Phellopilus nigrolimitatus]|nr:hypothetical protein DFH11DRAFT_412876 [Phellopilus nigrolimitatus]